MKVKFKLLSPDAVIPRYAKAGDAGLDLVAIDDGVWQSKPGSEFVEYGTGLSFEIPTGYVGLIFPRSSISNTTFTLSNSVGVLDSGYRGEVRFRFRLDGETVNSQSEIVKYKKGDRIGQLVIMPYPQIELVESEELSESERGYGGYGSSGT